MRKFIYKLAVFTLLILSILVLLLTQYASYIDYFYIKFTSSKQKALIVGDSRSFQGIQPSFFKGQIEKEFQLPIYNYSFTVAQATYGEAYLASMLKKIDPNTKNGLFILTVNPWLLAERENDDFEKGIYFETNLPPHNMDFPNMNPNFEYFFKNYNYFHFKAIARKITKVHKDGWMEDSTYPKDSIAAKKLKQIQIDLYNGFPKKWKKNDFRLQKLSKTITVLKKHGTVFLVRMPSSAPILAIENNFWVGFDADIHAIAKKNAVYYIDYTKKPNPYQSHDGVHLSIKGGELFTKSLCDSIIKHKKN